MDWHGDERKTRQLWRHWYSLHWRVLRALHIVDLEWSGSVVRAKWFGRARNRGEDRL